jgi:nucleoside-diphosphate-sugar epimerase
VVRPFSGYGSDQSLDFPFAAFINRALNREDPFKIWGSGTQTRDWIHIDDIVAGIMSLADAKATQPVNLCTGIATTFRELAALIFTKVEWAGGYDPKLNCDSSEPAGADYRVGDPMLFHEFYTPKITLAEGVQRALRGK